MAKRGENIRKRKDGRWEGRYIKHRDSDGKAVYGSVYGRTYTSVKEKLKEANNNQSEFLKGNKMTFGEALFLWLENNKIKQKTQTYSKYLQLINTQISPSIGHIKLLYGYQVANGRTVIHTEEAEVVKRVFSLYVQGKTLNSIATMLTEEKVAYFQGEVKWNKNTINRMIENEKYMGNEVYPKIISPSLFNQAKTVKEKKSCKQETHTGS